MLDIEPKKVMVCLDSDEDCIAAVEFAAVEAGRRQCGVQIVLALPPLWPGTRGVIDLRVMDGELRKATKR